MVSHAHADHLRAGSARYLVARDGLALAAARLPAGSVLEGLAYGQSVQLGDVQVSLHAAGHVLGSAQVRIESSDSVWVVSGDYKRAADPTCEAFEPIKCEVFLSEATFALPAYRWPRTETVIREIFAWWQANQERGVASVLFAYALGKAQRILAELAHLTDTSVYLHGAVVRMSEIYREAGIRMLPWAAVPEGPASQFAGALIIAPPSAAGSPWLRRFGDNASTAWCSGWMRVRGDRRRRGFDRGFVLSDHADWPALLATIQETGAQQVLLTHGRGDTLSRYLNESGLKAHPLATPYGAEE